MSEREARDALGVDPGSDEDTARQAYRRLAKETYPDGDQGTFRRVAEAYERLTGES
jgi:DnaJ-class molecular chaperone with C-terminal Zn finger domain